MTWTHLESLAARARARSEDPDGCGPLSDAAARAIMDYAVELMAARNGTMTAEDLAEALRKVASGASTEETSEALAMHISALGGKVTTLEQDYQGRKFSEEAAVDEANALRAKVAALEAEFAATEAERKRLSELAAVTECRAARRELTEARAELAAEKSLHEATQLELDRCEAELARLTPSGQVAEDVEQIRKVFAGVDWINDGKRLVTGALSRLAALAQRGETATESLDALRLRATKASAELRHAFHLETRDWNLVARAIRILEEGTTPKSEPTPEETAHCEVVP